MILTLFEHETRAVDLSPLDLRALERLRQTVGGEVLRPTISKGQFAIQATEYIGVVRLPGLTIQVLPKIYRASDAAAVTDRAREATANLLHMLALSGQVSIREHTLAPLLKQETDWFEILTYLFAMHLTEEWQRGAFRTYETFEDDLPVLKGRWRLAEQLRRPERRHSFAVAYDAFTADNPLNRIFRFAVERLWRATRDAANRQMLGNLRAWMEDVSLPARVATRDASPALITRLSSQSSDHISSCPQLERDTNEFQMDVGLEADDLV